jgi:ribonuclease P protein component
MFSKKKNEITRLKSKKEIELLFSEGNHLGTRPVKLVCTKTNSGFLYLGFGVSKRNFPRAVDRNRVKRLMRESVKSFVHSGEYTSFSGKGFFIYNGKELPTVKGIEAHVIHLIRRWNALDKS